MIKNIKVEKLDFRVNGAGTIRISKDADFLCKGEMGFSIGVSWGKHGFAGGTIPREEARRLAEHILTTLKANE